MTPEQFYAEYGPVNLPNPTFVALWLREVAGLPYELIGSQLGISPKAAQARVCRGRKAAEEMWDGIPSRCVEPVELEEPSEEPVSDDEALSIAEEAQVLLECLTGPEPAEKQRIEEDHWGRRLGLQSSPSLTVGDVFVVVQNGRFRRAARRAHNCSRER